MLVALTPLAALCYISGLKPLIRMHAQRKQDEAQASDQA
jgi:hypothetical protein